MTPIYNEFIQFLKNSTNNSSQLDFLEEGYYWLDNQIVKCFDKEQNIHSLCRLKVDSNDLTISCYVPSSSNYTKIGSFKPISWNELAELNKDHLEEITLKAKNDISLILKKHNDFEPIVLTSGGKDSSVTMDLVRSVVDAKGIFNNTTLDCADTYTHIKELHNIETINPDKGFYQWRKEFNFVPNRLARSCCTIFKEGAMVEKLNQNNKYLFFLGMRKEESNTRSSYEQEWNNEKWGENWKGFLPIIDWKEIDIWLYLILYNVSFNEKYKKGYSRAGCAIACPYASKFIWCLDKYWYPIMRKRWEEILKKDFIENKKWIIMNCTLEEYIQQAWSGGVFREEPTEETIEEFANYNNLEKEVARKYFLKTCNNCIVKNKKTGKEAHRKIKDKEVIAMNLKLHGRNTNIFLCKKCLMKEHNITKEKWNDMVEGFKLDGCDLF